MKFRGKHRVIQKKQESDNDSVNKKNTETIVSNDIKKVSKEIIKNIEQSCSGLLDKQQKIEKIKSIVLMNNTSNTNKYIDRLQKFINFTI
jgi:hypothetical protein